MYSIRNSDGFGPPRTFLETPHIWCNSKKKKYLSIAGTGNITITRLNLENGYRAGTFSCKAVNKDDPTDIIEITDGRFDIFLRTLNKD